MLRLPKFCARCGGFNSNVTRPLLTGRACLVVSPTISLAVDQVATATTATHTLGLGLGLLGLPSHPKHKPNRPQITGLNARARELLGYDVAGAVGGASADTYSLERFLSGQYRHTTPLTCKQ